MEEAVCDSLSACDTLLTVGGRQTFFKYCSTFDSTDQGNIGSVADTLLERRARLQEILVERRNAAGLTQVALAKLLRRPQCFVSKHETGERRWISSN
ncbi:four-carbon acid sugar kinase family protein [Roseomonas sp. CAU 1739]|uniref:four-carbon acid sugar kinase family protein n=1 Tax=Roseomonas sp. CAU 1739 TaxID=3140364 RepID=UPI0038D1D62C